MPYLSVIIPAYNEEKRIGGTLETINQYLSGQSYDYEIIVVNDGSKDGTANIVSNLKFKIKNLKLIDNQKNHGKGYVVRQGILEAKGDYRLFTDADNSTSIDQIEKFWPHIHPVRNSPPIGPSGAQSAGAISNGVKEGYDIVIGSIEVPGAKIIEHAQWYRRILGRWSKFLIRVVAGLWEIHDTQRGFKLFSAKSARDIFSKVKIERFGFDIEVLALAKKLKYKVKEVPVEWNNPGESKVSLKSYIATFRDLITIRWNLWTRKYNV